MDEQEQQVAELIEAATAVRRQAYTPYSGFAVGAALRGASGRLYTGCNVENVSYGLACCAERNAVFHAVSQGERAIVAAAVVTDAEAPTSPCGACRQVLLEFAPDGAMEIVLATLSGTRRHTTIAALLPESFSSFMPDTPPSQD